jgi:hypothetical protein
MHRDPERLERVARVALRLALAAGFLSAVADRFGLWGAPGAPGVAWGAWGPFVAYTGTLNGFLPAAFIPTVAAAATAAEVVLAGLLLAGRQLRRTALASAALLGLFAFAMTAALGPKPPLDYSVFAAAAGALALAALAGRPRTPPAAP